MFKTLKVELKRSFCNKLFLLSIIISCVLVLWYSFERLPFCIDLNNTIGNDMILDDFLEVSYMNWIGSHNIFLQQNIFYLIIPFLAVLPYGASLFSDMKNGYVKGIITRTEKKYYLISKYISVFLSGGVAVVAPMIFSFLISSAVLPTALPEVSYAYTNIHSIYKWADLLFVHPLAYTLLYISIVFIFSGLLASIALGLSYFSDKSFLVLLFPFFIYIFTSLVFELLDLNGFSIREVLTTTGEQGTTMTVLILIIGYFAISFFPYFFVGVKKDVF